MENTSDCFAHNLPQAEPPAAVMWGLNNTTLTAGLFCFKKRDYVGSPKPSGKIVPKYLAKSTVSLGSGPRDVQMVAQGKHMGSNALKRRSQ